MFRSIDIQNFRGFHELHLRELGRVNLLVGENNSGKTTVLEAVQFLASGGDIGALVAALGRRLERSLTPEDERSRAPLDPRFLFRGRSLEGNPIVLDAESHNGPVNLRVSVRQIALEEEADLVAWRQTVRRRSSRDRQQIQPLQASLFEENLSQVDRIPRFMEVFAGQDVIGQIPLVRGTILDEGELLIGTSRGAATVQFVGTSSLRQPLLAQLLDGAVVSGEEAGVIDALNAIEEEVVRVRAVGDFNRSIVVGLRDAPIMIPLGSLGDGMSRMLAIALSLVTARGGYLLIDEIDTGLHHSVMRKMWRLVFEAVKRLNVCVYATTHSYDCVHALAAIANPEVRKAGDVALLRIERDRPDAVHFSEREITLLAERHIEAR